MTGWRKDGPSSAVEGVRSAASRHEPEQSLLPTGRSRASDFGMSTKQLSAHGRLEKPRARLPGRSRSKGSVGRSIEPGRSRCQ